MPIDDYDSSSLDSSQDSRLPPRPVAVRRAPRAWLPHALLAVGALAAATTVFWVQAQRHHAPIRIDADEVIEAVMQRNYGAYSPAQKGWLWTGPQHAPYLMQVVQRAKVEPEDGAQGDDELYFVAAGTPLRPTQPEPALTGLFQVKGDMDKRDGSLLEISTPLRQEQGAVPLQPQDVKFLALGSKTWGWVLTTHYATKADDKPAATWQVVMAPQGVDMAELVRFPASLEDGPGKGCEPAASPAKAPATEPDDRVDEAPGGAEGQRRCSHARWTYRAGPVPAQGLLSFSVTGGGLVNGEQRPQKTWQLVFDAKRFRYTLPEGLSF
ncbi:MAG TPA: hypothetical protein VLA61_08960 [Ideonella sp.]|uniref:hypothetical protein n=1 Tax=Ideonella sp. TaxID=1929293 RepID=UPI002CF690A7|nr:hypothetical protein [Ideonella sp.]HSI48384.1 hypothetical protein [Ideonella sp.]